DASDDPHSKKDNGRLAQGQTKTAENQSAAKEHGCSGCRRAWAATFDPRTSKRRAQAEQHQSRGERGVGRAEPPRIGWKQLLNGSIEGAPRVDRPDTNVHRNCTKWNLPAAR